MHQVGVNRQGIGQSVGPEITGQLLDRRIGGDEGSLSRQQQRSHHTSPARIACTTGTV